jgi:hypothetical protein
VTVLLDVPLLNPGRRRSPCSALSLCRPRCAVLGDEPRPAATRRTPYRPDRRL